MEPTPQYTTQQPWPYPSSPQPYGVTGPAGANASRYVPAIVGAIGGLMVMVGSFMPWGVIRSIFGTITVSGTDGDGIITMVAGLALAGGFVLTAVVRLRWLRVAQTIAAGLTFLLGGYELANVSDAVREASSQYAVASVGAGLYVLLVGALVATVAAIVDVARREV